MHIGLLIRPHTNSGSYYEHQNFSSRATRPLESSFAQVLIAPDNARMTYLEICSVSGKIITSSVIFHYGTQKSR